MIDDRHCRGCTDDFYNGRNPAGVQRCWHLSSAELVTRYRIGTWTMPASPGAFTEVEVASCYRRVGEHFYARLPDFVRAEDVVRRRTT